MMKFISEVSHGTELGVIPEPLTSVEGSFRTLCYQGCKQMLSSCRMYRNIWHRLCIQILNIQESSSVTRIVESSNCVLLEIRSTKVQTSSYISKHWDVMHSTVTTGNRAGWHIGKLLRE